MSRIWFRMPVFHTNLTSFLFLLDLKVGCSIITLFALFNKIAGIYGIIAIFQGGTFSQVSLYLYSIFTIFIFLWAIQGISDEDQQRVMKFAHVFLADHMLSSTWTLYFALDWFFYRKHDGEKPKLNDYQQGLMGLIESIESQYETPGTKIHHQLLEGQARVDAAQSVWKGERGFSAAVLGLGWLLKIYFALVLYSYALHLRHGTYRKLPLSKPSGYNQPNGNYRAVRGQSFELGAVDDEELPAWSEDEEEEISGKPSGGQSGGTSSNGGNNIPSKSDSHHHTEPTSLSANDIVRPQSRTQVTGRRGSNMPPGKEGPSNEDA